MKSYHSLLFLGLLLGLSIYYDYHKILQKAPRGCHVWRQTDCASFALNYYERDMNFFHPQMHNQLGDEGETVSEFPIIYYTSALFYHLFSPNEVYLRGLNLLLFLGGLIALFLLTYKLTGSRFWAYIPPLFLLSSPILLFYGNNFLPEVPALSLALFGWYFLYRYSQHLTYTSLITAGLLFTLAGLLKITALISVVGLFLLFIIHWLIIPHINLNQLFDHKRTLLIFFASIMLFVTSWYVFADYYKEIHETYYLLTDIRPIWESEWSHIEYTFERTVYFWSEYYAPKLTRFAFVVLTVIGLLYYLLKLPKFRFWEHLTFLSLLGAISATLLWFPQLLHHDYYVIPFFIYPVFLLLMIIKWGQQHFPRIFQSIYLKGGVVLILLLHVQYGKTHLHKKYQDFAHENPDAAFYSANLSPFLLQHGIQKQDKVVSIPDRSPNRTLYFLNRKGWTSLNLPQTDSSGIRQLIRQGAQYLIINDSSYLHKPSLQPVLKDSLGKFRSLYFYDLQNL